MKRCSKCKAVKPEEDFHKSSGTKDGLRCDCKICALKTNKNWRMRNKEKYDENHRKAQYRWFLNNREASIIRGKKNYQKMQARRNMLVSEAKEKSGGCAICGETRHACLVFHHLKEKEIEICKLRTVPSIKRELGKCIVLCSNCHLLHHVGGMIIPDNVQLIDVDTLETK